MLAITKIGTRKRLGSSPSAQANRWQPSSLGLEACWPGSPAGHDRFGPISDSAPARRRNMGRCTSSAGDPKVSSDWVKSINTQTQTGCARAVAGPTSCLQRGDERTRCARTAQGCDAYQGHCRGELQPHSGRPAAGFEGSRDSPRARCPGWPPFFLAGGGEKSPAWAKRLLLLHRAASDWNGSD